MTRLRKFFIFPVLLVVACAKNNHGKGADLVHRIPTQNLQESQDLAKGSIVQCADSAACPPAVGMLSAASATDLATCTSFLVGPDLVLTSLHCLPPDLAGTPCRERIKVVFPASSSYPSTEISCLRVESHSSENSEEINAASPREDYALIRLEQKTDRPPIPLSRNGLGDGEHFDLYKVDPTNTAKPQGILKHVVCMAVQSTLAVPAFTTNLSSVASLGDCEMVRGNSGSPFVNAKGEAAAIAQAIIQQAAIWRRFQENPGATAPLVSATNLACVNLPELAWTADKACVASAETDPNLAAAELLNLRGIESRSAAESAREAAEIENGFSPWIQANSATFAWTQKIGAETEFSRVVTLAPACIQTPVDRGQSYALASFSSGLPAAIVKVLLNHYLQPVIHTEIIFNQGSTEISWSPKTLAEQGIAEVSIKAGPRPATALKLGVCEAKMVQNWHLLP